MQKEKKKTLWITVANVLACFSVVVLHCNSVFWRYENTPLWKSANLVETFFYFAVPVFFMLSGATLLDYRERYDTKTFIKKRFIETVVPYLCWSLFAFVWATYYMKFLPYEGLRATISNILTNSYNGIYWFFPALFSVYLSIPLLSAVKKGIRLRVFSYVAVVAFLTISLLPTLLNLAHIKFSNEFKLPIAGGYILYALLGYIVANVDFSKKQRGIIYATSIMGWLIHFIGTDVLSGIAGELSATLKGYLNFPAVMQAVGVIVFIKYFPWEKYLKKGTEVLNLLASCTFGVYLIHRYVLDVIYRQAGFDMADIRWRIFGPFGVFFLCFGISYLLSKIPLLKRTVGV
ncbi:acyltransferase family protein [Candidatus Saccharibacteria bacterium]|nr:acyltransferase family protein [Candidatus Saccharibacteria bacterium]